MFRVPRQNAIILALYCVVAAMVFVATLVSPAFRGFQAISYAPLRELLLPPPEPVVLSVLYSTEKEDWLHEVTASFLATHPTVNGLPIQVKLKPMGSREMYLSVLDGAERPDVIAPAGSTQIAMLRDLYERRWGRAIVNPADQAACRSVLKTPLVLVAWRERADALWDEANGAGLWRRVHDVLVEPKGWVAFGHPEWSYVKFAHTNPLKSNSGLMTLVLMAYDYFGKTAGLTASDLSDEGFQKWINEVEGSISQFPDSSGPFLKDMIAYGPSTYDFISAYEASALEQVPNARSRFGDLHVYYPATTVVSDHPFCALQAEWVTPDEASAARYYIDYLTGTPAQELAVQKHGFRPTNESVAVDGPGSPFSKHANNGFQVDLPTVAEVPTAEVLNNLLDLWSRKQRTRQ